MSKDIIDKPRKKDIKKIIELIDTAEEYPEHLSELLYTLKFIPGPLKLHQFRRYIYFLLDKYLDPIIAVALSTIALIVIDVEFSKLFFLILAFLITFVRWIRKQRSEYVKDAMERKDRTNSMIINYPLELEPYTANVFDSESKYEASKHGPEKRAIINMYIFSELDNLEFVYDKSRAGLLEDAYTFRAIKIFLSRSENTGFFRVAVSLIKSGRYNDEFKRVIEFLLKIGRYKNLKNIP